MKHCREENRPIVYMAESYMLSLISQERWSDDSEKGLHIPAFNMQ